jgi:hypothetical protein
MTAHNTHNRQAFMSLAIFEPTVSAGERPQTYALGRGHTILTSREDSVSRALDCATTGTDRSNLHNYSLKITDVHHISVQTSTWPVFRITCSIFNFLVKGMISCSVQTPHFKLEYIRMPQQNTFHFQLVTNEGKKNVLKCVYQLIRWKTEGGTSN